MQQFVLALDLKNDPHLITQYEAHHKAVWPEIIQSIEKTGIIECNIYRIENRLTMILITTDEFTFEAKAISDNQNPKVQEWETLMWQYQQALPTAKPHEKWMICKHIFTLKK